MKPINQMTVPEMNTEISSRITTTGRTKLETVIPLSTPYLVFLDPSDICNAKCSWCPTGSGETKKYRKPQLMEWDVFRKVIDDLADMPEWIKVLRLYKDGEPLLNPLFPDMVWYAKKTGIFKQVDTTTNGILLTDSMSDRIIASGLDKIFISLRVDYDERDLRNIYYLHHRAYGQPKVHVKIIGDTLTEEEKYGFLNDMEGVCDSCGIEHLSPCWPNFKVEGAGDIGIYGQPLHEVAICPYLFYSCAINSNGTVSACFLDWNQSMVIGDIKDTSFKDIWNGSMMKAYRDMHLNKKRYFHPMCGDCGQLKYGQADDIDKYAEEILGRLTL